MNVVVCLDPKVGWRLTDDAERRGLTLGEYLAELVTPRVSPPPVSAAQTRDDVVALHAEGLTDTEIAERVGRVREHVARLRRAAGLKTNKKKEY